MRPQPPGHFRPTSTYRFQLRNGVRLDDIRQLTEYLAELGVGTVYLSPILESRPDSTHGYDVVEPSRIDPTLGDEGALSALAQGLAEYHIGILLDIVPNHMAAHASNPWWWDVLARGRNSEHARCFDIDWELGDGKILLPVLGAPLEEVLTRGEILLDQEEARGWVFRYYEHVWPASGSLEAIQNAQRSGEALAELLRAQAYEPRAYDEALALNYRRFFNINELVGVRVEDPAVFEATHGAIFDWVQRGWVHGLRIDHPDGLLDPPGYLERLSERVARAPDPEWDGPREPGYYIVVEKILMGDEKLSEGWPVAGTTGYEQLNWINGVFVDAAADQALNDFYIRFTDRGLPFEDVAYRSRGLVLDTLLHVELDRLCAWFGAALGEEREIDALQMKQALRAVIASFPVYRTYIGEDDTQLDQTDAAVIDAALSRARAREPELPKELFDLLESTLRLAAPSHPEGRKCARHALLRLQQLTGPAAAKGIEDTAMYRFFPLASLDEVGGEPHRFGIALEAFHEANAERAERWPWAMTASTTHDTKRSEDVRARLNVLSEIPEEWASAVEQWHELVRPALTELDRSNAPDRNDEYLIFQTLVGAWPREPHPNLTEFAERMRAYFEKAFREAKRHTRWIAQSPEYEQGVADFLDAILGAGRHSPLLEALSAFCQRLEPAASLNSLSALILKLAGPGVPDIYQGTELFDLSLVDPDNRRSVDFELRRSMLQELRGRSRPPEWEEGLTSGALKLWLTHKGLQLRRAQPHVFGRSRYLPVRASGSRAQQIVAFSRIHERDAVVAVTGRFFTRFGAGQPLGHNWGDTTLEVPAELPRGHYRDVLTGSSLQIQPGSSIPVVELFQTLPFALLMRVS